MLKINGNTATYLGYKIVNNTTMMVYSPSGKRVGTFSTLQNCINAIVRDYTLKEI